MKPTADAHADRSPPDHLVALLSGGTVHANPQPFVNALREIGEMHRTGEHWWCTGYNAAQQVLTDPRIRSSGGYATFSGVEGGPLLEMQQRWVETCDGALHERLRPAVASLFRRDLLNSYRQSASNSLAKVWGTLKGNQSFDLVLEVLDRFEIDLVGEWIGLDPRGSAALIACTQSVAATMGASRDDMPNVFVLADALTSAYLDELDGLASTAGGMARELCAAANSGRLRDDREISAQLANIAFDVLGIGSQLALVLYELLHRPEAMTAVANDVVPVDVAVRELLRLAPAAPLITRRVFEETVVADTKVNRDEWLIVHLGAANRDPTLMEDPGAFVPNRPTRPLTFGAGIHSCLGATLTTRVIEDALAFLPWRRMQTEGSVKWHDGPYRGIESWIVQIE